jgi:hypothetical protein
MMKKSFLTTSLIAVSMLIFLIKPARSSTNDIVCEFKYKMGDKVWVIESGQGTTRIQAKKNRSQQINFLKSIAKEKNQELKIIYLQCSDPWGY